jgi:hypothetical protein
MLKIPPEIANFYAKSEKPQHKEGAACFFPCSLAILSVAGESLERVSGLSSPALHPLNLLRRVITS